MSDEDGATSGLWWHGWLKTSVIYTMKIFGRSLLYILTPIYYLIFLSCILPEVATFFKLGVTASACAFAFQIYLLINLIGNLILLTISDPKINFAEPISVNQELLCRVCQSPSPEGLRYCPVCKNRVRKAQDYEWMFENIGMVTRQYKRYYTLYLLHASLSMLTGLVWTLTYLISKHGVRFNKDPSIGTAVFLSGSFLFFFFIFPLTYLRVTNALYGLTMRERVQRKKPCPDWQGNLAKVLGTHWVLATFWPFTHSPPSVDLVNM